MVECGVCLEEYQEGDLELHRQMCVVRLMFRCSFCDEDYVSKEGLWNHLDQHEIVDDESKELHYQEIKAKHKLHQCVLCNDQRAYSESSYWKHIHDVHDGFFLRCSDCGENFRSEKLKNDHAFSHSKSRDQMEEQVPTEVEHMTSDADHLKPTRREQSSIATEELNNGSIEHSGSHLNNNITEKESEFPTNNSTKRKDLPSRFACDICGMTFSFKGVLLRHKRAKYSCMQGGQQKCPHCWRVFRIKEYQAHFPLCKKKKISCELCPLKFRTPTYLAKHKRNVHRDEGVAKNAKQGKDQAKNIMGKTINLVRRTTRRSGPDTLVSSPDSSSSSNVVEDANISTPTKDIADKSVQPSVENPPSRSSDTKCIHCEKECVSAYILRKHIAQNHQPTKCNICGITFQGTTKVRYHKIRKHTEPRHECPKCLKKFHCIYIYKRHSNVCDAVPNVAAENPSSEPSGTKCSHCGIEESSAVTLARHILMQHDPVACDFCGITLSSLSQAQDHMKTMHKESKNKCPKCSMQFSWSGRLQKHVSKCENSKLPCEFCGKMFENVTAVNKHKRRTCRAYKMSKEESSSVPLEKLSDDSSTILENVSPPLDECGLSKTRCYFCDEEFYSPGHLNHHLRIFHELTKCDICGMTVLGVSEFKHHKITCHKKPKYECPTCGSKFRRKRKYDAHCCSSYEHNIKRLSSVKWHKDRYHSDEGSSKNLQIDEDQRQSQNVDLKMEITVEETTIASHDDLGQSTVNLSTEIDVSCGKVYEAIGSSVDSPPNEEHSLANLNHDEFMDSQVPDKESQIAPSNGSSEKQVVTEKISQPLVENLSNPRYSCKICGITLPNQHQTYYHMLTRHTEGKYQCPHCPKKWHNKRDFRKHASYCAGLEHSCDLCGQKFNLLSRLEKHKTRVHHGNRSLRDANIEGADGTDEQKQISTEKIEAVHQMTFCVICRTSFASTDELMKHKTSCPEHAKEHDDSQFGAEESSLLHGVKRTQTDSTIIAQGENIDLNLEIKVEETMLQEQEYQVPQEEPGRSFATTLAAEDADELEYGIEVKEEYLEDEEDIITEHQITSDPMECHEDPSDRNESFVRHEVIDVHSKVVKKKSHSQRRRLSSDCTETRRSKRIRLEEEN